MMGNLGVIREVLGPVDTNAYILYNKDTKESIFIDPADDAGRLIAITESHGLHPQAILLTHGHFDHVLALDGVRERYGLKAYIHAADEELLEDPRKGGGKSMMGLTFSTKADAFIEDGDVLSFLGHDIVFFTTPGHSKGSGCFYIENEHILFTGDTIFFEDCGRTDLYGGDEYSLIRSVLDKVFILPDDVLCFPGHMGSTSIGHEKVHNPIAIYARKHGL